MTLCNDKDECIKKMSKPNFKNFRIINENLVAIEAQKAKVELCKPIYVGFSILDISKTLMYDFHYNVMKKKFGDNIHLLFTDTDSLCYEIITEDFNQNIKDIVHLFDFSDYPAEHPMHDKKNAKVIGKFKDEACGKEILEFVGLRPKMYSLLYSDKEIKKDKGVKGKIVKKKLKHEHYKNCLNEKKNETVDMNMIRSYNHQVFSIAMKKIGLSYEDDKRIVLPDGHNTLAYGHIDTYIVPELWKYKLQ
jgi:hypothetical protein